jgi:hypothetical protein
MKNVMEIHALIFCLDFFNAWIFLMHQISAWILFNAWISEGPDREKEIHALKKIHA